MSTSKTPDLRLKESRALEPLRKIAWDIDSPNLGTMYDAVGRLASLPVSRLLLPKTLDLVTSSDKNVKQAAFTVIGKNAYGEYLSEFFAALKAMNPAEREQVLQGIQEMFIHTGGPTTIQEQKNWIRNLESLGREHQPAVFELMAFLGKSGLNWVLKQIRNNIKGLSLGSVPTLSLFPDNEKKQVIGILSKKAAKERRDLIPYICGIIDIKTQGHLQIFLRKSTWQERVDIAAAVASTGIRSSTGFIMELVADPKWQVKQALLENIRIESSKMNALFMVLSHLLAESHARVRAQAERTLLLLGNLACEDTTLRQQRKRLEKKFRTQLLKAAQGNKDIDVKWLGIERKQADPMVDIMQKVTSEEGNVESIENSMDRPVGVSLTDLAKLQSSPKDGINEQEKSMLLSALLGAKQAVTEEEPAEKKEGENLFLDPTIPATSRFILVMQRVAEDIGKNVPLNILINACVDAGMSEDEFNKALTELEKQGIVYRSSEDTVSYVDIEL